MDRACACKHAYNFYRRRSSSSGKLEEDMVVELNSSFDPSVISILATPTVTLPVALTTDSSRLTMVEGRRACHMHNDTESTSMKITAIMAPTAPALAAPAVAMLILEASGGGDGGGSKGGGSGSAGAFSVQGGGAG